MRPLLVLHLVLVLAIRLRVKAKRLVGRFPFPEAISNRESGIGLRSLQDGVTSRSPGSEMSLCKLRASRIDEMKTNTPFRMGIAVAIILLGASVISFAQTVAKLQMAELTKKLQLTEQQQKQIAPLVVERDKKVKALEENTSAGKLQKLKQAMQIQTDFRNNAAKYLNADQVKKLEALQAERRAKLTQGS